MPQVYISAHLKDRTGVTVRSAEKMLLSVAVLLLGALLAEGGTLDRTTQDSRVTGNEVNTGTTERLRDDSNDEKEELARAKGSNGGGVVYTRWGRTTCPDTKGTERLYKGIASGSQFTHQGGGASYLCVPEEPEYSYNEPGPYTYANYLSGAQYQADGPYGSRFVPCAVCYTSEREVVFMLPANLTCPQKWTLEYNGYLMAAYYNDHRATYECMDRNPEFIYVERYGDPALFYITRATCSGLPCPPYDNYKQITCAVCSR